MKIAGMMLCRNESWIMPCTVDAAMKWVDTLYILDDDSTDGTCELVSKWQTTYGKDRIKLYFWPHEEYWAEMDARQYLYEMAKGATHYAIIDADEMLTANHLGYVRQWFQGLKPGDCLDVPMIAPWKGLQNYSPATTGVITLGFMDLPGLCWKPRGAEQYHHHSRPPQGARARINPLSGFSDGGCFHLQWVHWDRKLWKERHYMMTERLRWGYPTSDINAKYHWWFKLPHGDNLSPVPEHWYRGYNLRSIRLDQEPWYKSACERLVEKHGKEAFQGLDLFGWQP